MQFGAELETFQPFAGLNSTLGALFVTTVAGGTKFALSTVYDGP